MDAGPRMAASFVQGTLDSIARADADLGRRVRQGLRPETLETLGSASRISLIPVEIDVEITEQLFAHAGRDRGRAILRDALASTFESPLFGSFLQTALRLRGSNPGRLFGWCSKVWNQIYRDAGDMHFVPVGDSEGRLQLERLPEVMCNDTYLDGTAATVSAVFSIVGVEGTARLGALDASIGRAVISAAWEPRD
ncbi:MAG: hypothetical protein ACQGVC_22825 [Myxococcota bacterium]